MTSTPNPILLAKLNRLALQFLATSTLRTEVTKAIQSIALEDLSAASPALRLKLYDEHVAALNWMLDESFFDDPEPVHVMSET